MDLYTINIGFLQFCYLFPFFILLYENSKCNSLIYTHIYAHLYIYIWTHIIYTIYPIPFSNYFFFLFILNIYHIYIYIWTHIIYYISHSFFKLLFFSFFFKYISYIYIIIYLPPRPRIFLMPGIPAPMPLPPIALLIFLPWLPYCFAACICDCSLCGLRTV